MTDLEQDIISKIEALRTYCGMKILESPNPSEDLMHMRIELSNLAIKFNRLVKTPPESIYDIIEKIENKNFRTVHDTGASLGAMMIWSCLRVEVDLPPLSKNDLPKEKEGFLGYPVPEGSNLVSAMKADGRLKK
jgi:hypothetical protein